jgi:hypothetical protein
MHRERELFLAVRFLEKGYLPHPGSWAQQHAVLVQALEIVWAQLAAIERERMERKLSQEVE